MWISRVFFPSPKAVHARRSACYAGCVIVACLAVSPIPALAQCAAGFTKFTVDIVQLVPTAAIKAEIGPPPHVSPEEFERQMSALAPAEVTARISGLNRAFKPASICFEWDGAVKAMPFDLLRVEPGSFAIGDPILSPFFAKFTPGKGVLRFLIVPEIHSGILSDFSPAGECPLLNIDGVSSSDIPLWKRQPKVPDICILRRIVFSDSKGQFDGDYAVIHEAGHWLGLSHSFDTEYAYKLANDVSQTDQMDQAKGKMRLEQSAEAFCKSLPRQPPIAGAGFDGIKDSPVQPVPAGCDVAYSCSRGPDGRLLQVQKGNPMDYGYDQSGCTHGEFRPGQITILKRGAQYRK